ncbi:MAG TPA: hypothetical protein DCL61_17255, partial [Cyanobacteria bacterium UBA12227]|nr:hypothetical protein [Cyanobacteria bacterium UBA12227]
IGGSSKNIQHEPNQILDSDRTGGNTNWRNIPIINGGGDFGKILSRVEKIEAEYICYLKAQEDRLRTRLNENLENQRKAIEEIQQLKNEIAELIINEMEKGETNEISETGDQTDR